MLRNVCFGKIYANVFISGKVYMKFMLNFKRRCFTLTRKSKSQLKSESWQNFSEQNLSSAPLIEQPDSLFWAWYFAVKFYMNVPLV